MAETTAGGGEATFAGAAGLATMGPDDAADSPAVAARGAAGGGIAVAKAAGVAKIGGFAVAGSSTRGASATRKIAPHGHLTRS